MAEEKPKKKGIISGLIEKLDKKMEKEAEKSCGCSCYKKKTTEEKRCCE